MEFKEFKTAVQIQMDAMSGYPLFRTDVSKDDLWEMYLKSFPEGSNPIFRERTEHDCQCCKQFIRAGGNMVGILDNQLTSIWDINIGGDYQVVADAMSNFVKSKSIIDSFLHTEKTIGTDVNYQQLESEDVLTWEHFHYKLPSKFVNRDPGTQLSKDRTCKEVFKRSLNEIYLDAAETVLELIEQNSLYRGEEHKSIVELFIAHKKIYDDLPEEEKDNYCWSASKLFGSAAMIRNTVIGTLMTDVSERVALDSAVRMFESKVAPTNYKRPSAVITKSMISNAEKKVSELGIESSLTRRYAVTEDITINNVKFANREAKKAMNVFDELKSSTPDNIKNLDKVESVGIKTFMEDILPKSTNVELMIENSHVNNLMSLVSPSDSESTNILKWNNNFSWAYKGEVADSMKQRVKKAGGNVEGILRFSIQWNDDGDNPNDFDAHCIEPNGNKIYFQNKTKVHPSSGVLDVDIIDPGPNVAVENITWSDKTRMQEGRYQFIVHNYSHCGGKTGFTAELEYEGKVYSYEYIKELRDKEKVLVAEIAFTREIGISITDSLPEAKISKEVWGINTNTFNKVSMIMNSPNHWDGNKTGNKHYFFILEDCLNPESARGFFNEFLNEDLREHRKVFEVLGSKMKVEKSDKQLSGVGFSSTQDNSVIVKVDGSFSRMIKINF